MFILNLDLLPPRMSQSVQTSTALRVRGYVYIYISLQVIEAIMKRADY